MKLSEVRWRELNRIPPKDLEMLIDEAVAGLSGPPHGSSEFEEIALELSMLARELRIRKEEAEFRLEP